MEFQIKEFPCIILMQIYCFQLSAVLRYFLFVNEERHFLMKFHAKLQLVPWTEVREVF